MDLDSIFTDISHVRQALDQKHAELSSFRDQYARLEQFLMRTDSLRNSFESRQAERRSKLQRLLGLRGNEQLAQSIYQDLLESQFGAAQERVLSGFQEGRQRITHLMMQTDDRISMAYREIEMLERQQNDLMQELHVLEAEENGS